MPAAAHGPDLAAGMLDPDGGVVEDLGEEVPDVRGVDPGGAELGFDLAGHQVGRDDLAEFGGVDLVAGIICRGPFGGFELVPDPAGQVLRGGDQPPGFGIVEDVGAQFLAGLLLAGAEQPGHRVQPGFPEHVQADGERVGGGVGAQPRVAGGDDAAGEDRGLGGGLADRVELLQRLDQGRERVGAEAALRRSDAGQPLLSRRRVGAAGVPPGEPADRAVGLQVGVVAAVKVLAQVV